VIRFPALLIPFYVAVLEEIVLLLANGIIGRPARRSSSAAQRGDLPAETLVLGLELGDSFIQCGNITFCN
jgi:hypothetical protein